MKIKSINISENAIKKAIVERIVDDYIRKRRFSLIAFDSKVDDVIKEEVLKEIKNSKKVKNKIKKLLNDDKFIRKSIQKAVIDYVMGKLRWGWEE